MGTLFPIEGKSVFILIQYKASNTGLVIIKIHLTVATKTGRTSTTTGISSQRHTFALRSKSI